MSDTKEKIVKAALVIIGDEILSGRTQDANLSYLATWLNERGVRLDEARVVPDVTERIIAAVNACRAQFDYVFTTGGIGPTHDDITADAIARAFDVPLEYHPEAMALMARQYATGDFTDARKRMARIPKGGDLIENPVSIAPGFQIENVFVLAGVPLIMRTMLDSLGHKLVGGAPVVSQSISVPMPESALADDLARIAKARPSVQIGSYPYYREGRVGLNVVVRSTDEAEVKATIEDVESTVRSHGVTPNRTPHTD